MTGPRAYHEPDERYLRRLAHHQAVAKPYADKSLLTYEGGMGQACYDLRRHAKNDAALMTALQFLGAHYAVEVGVREGLLPLTVEPDHG